MLYYSSRIIICIFINPPSIMKSIKINQRDLFLLQGLLKYFMTIEQVMKYLKSLHPELSKNIDYVYTSRRLREMFLNKIVKRSICILGKKNALKPSYYYFLNFFYAKRYIPELEDLPKESKIFNPIQSSLIEHELFITNIMISFEESFKNNDYKMVSFFRDGSFHDYFKFKNESVSIIPDGVIVVNDNDDKTHLIFLEADRSSQEILSIGKLYHSMIRKFQKYEIYIKGKKFNPVSFLKISSVKVVIITKNDERIKNIIMACKADISTDNIFYFLSEKNLSSDKNLLKDGFWKGIKGNNCSLF